MRAFSLCPWSALCLAAALLADLAVPAGVAGWPLYALGVVLAGRHGDRRPALISAAVGVVLLLAPAALGLGEAAVTPLHRAAVGLILLITAWLAPLSGRVMRRLHPAESATLAHVSHEMRDPLTGILGMTRLALKTDLTVRQRDYLEVVEASGQALLSLINDILDYNKMEAGRLSLHPTAFSPRRMLRQAARPFAIRAEEKGLIFRTEVDPALPDRLVGDSRRLSQILTNLLANAIKFTDNGQVTLRADLNGVGHSDALVRYTVEDTGIGIAADRLEDIFVPFEQADEATAGRYGGSGLGLAIVRELARLMGGRVDVASEPSRGSRFSLSLLMPIGPTEPVEPPEPLTVLLADDDGISRQVAAASLEADGHSVVLAVDGAAAAKELSAGRFDLAVLDLTMPGLGGLEVAALLRAAELPDGRTPALALTGHDGPDTREQCLAAGFDGHLVKPFDPDDLRREVARLAPSSRVETRAEVDLEDTTPERKAGVRDLFDEADLRHRCQGDDALVNRVVGLFLDEGPRAVAGLREALEAEDATALAEAAHTFKGTAGYLGSASVAAGALRVESAARAGDLTAAGPALAGLAGRVDCLLTLLRRRGRPGTA